MRRYVCHRVTSADVDTLQRSSQLSPVLRRRRFRVKVGMLMPDSDLHFSDMPMLHHLRMNQNLTEVRGIINELLKVGISPEVLITVAHMPSRLMRTAATWCSSRSSTTCAPDKRFLA